MHSDLNLGALISTKRGSMENRDPKFEHEMLAYIVEQTDSSIDKPKGWDGRYIFLASLVIEVARIMTAGQTSFLTELTVFIQTLTKKVVASKEEF